MVPAVDNGKLESVRWQHDGRDFRVLGGTAPASGAVLILVPGPWEPAAALTPIALELIAHGHEAHILELPTSAAVTEPLEARQHVAWLARYISEQQAAQPDKPLRVLGVGLGGTLAYAAVSQLATAPAALWLTCVVDARRDAVRRKLLGPAFSPLLTGLALRLLAPLRGRHPMPMPAVEARPFHRDFERSEAIARLVQPAPIHTLRFVSSLLTLAPAIEPEDFRRCPVVLAAPTADAWLDLEPSLDFFRRLPGPKELRMLEGCGHLPLDRDCARALVAAFRA